MNQVGRYFSYNILYCLTFDTEIPSDCPLWLAQSYSNEQYREEGDHLYKVRLVSAVIKVGKSDYKNKLQGQTV